MRVAHLADLHFSNKPDKLEEVVRCTDFAVRAMVKDFMPDLIILAGDTVDEADGPIRADSDAFRAAVRFVSACADIAPVAICLGTPSHDRKTPLLFRDLRGANEIYVSDRIEMIGITQLGQFTFPEAAGLAAMLTFLPSPDKSHCIGTYGGGSLSLTTMNAKEALHDALAYIGECNKAFADIPKIVIGHGMITGAEYSSGTVSTGEDLEFSVHDLRLAGADITCFGHVHKWQAFSGNIYYAGSPGRLNFGEQEEKGFLIHDITGNHVASHFVKTPAREFLLKEVEWVKTETTLAAATEVAATCTGKDVRFRYTIPEELRHTVDRNVLTQKFLDAGARLAKVEAIIIPTVRQRAAGISRLETLPEKILKWAETTGADIPDRVLSIAATIEGEATEELILKAKGAIA